MARGRRRNRERTLKKDQAANHRQGDIVKIEHAPIAKAEMLIRKPIAKVFEAFVDPAITTKFWFTKGSGRLETGKQIHWDWEMYDISVQVTVKAISYISQSQWICL